MDCFLWYGAVSILPFMEGLENVFRYGGMPKTAITTSDEVESVGSDQVEKVLRERAVSDQATSVPNRIFYSSRREPTSRWSFITATVYAVDIHLGLSRVCSVAHSYERHWFRERAFDVLRQSLRTRAK